MSKESLAILGAGSWGTALAMVLARNGHDVDLWCFDPKQAHRMQQTGQNADFLPDLALSERIHVSDNLGEIVAKHRNLMIVVPSHVFRATLLSMKSHLRPDARIAWATKGVEADTHELLSKAVTDELGDIPMVVLAGPSFAKEVAHDMPTAVCVSGNNVEFEQFIIEKFHHGHFRVYQNNDMIGMQLCGAMKNVIAIAAGILSGMQLGANTHAALITRGIAEMTRLTMAMGGQAETVYGLVGLGDLVLTCGDDLSRNRRFGKAIGEGWSTQEAITRVKQVVEGYYNTKQVYTLAQDHKIDMPIITKVYQVLFEDLAPKDAIKQLMAREPKAE